MSKVFDNKTLEQIRDVYNSGRVERYHTNPAPVAQTIAQHSWGVAVLILKLHPNPDLNLISAALHHDCAELYVGDVPAPTKWDNPELSDMLHKLESKISGQMGIMQEYLTEEDEEWLRACDRLELVLWCEHLAYNLVYAQFETIMERGIIALRDNPKTPGRVLDYLDDQYGPIRVRPEHDLNARP